MNAARTDQNDVIFSESYELVVEIQCIVILQRHNDLNGRVPVRRIVFVLVVVIELKGSTGLAIDGLNKAIQSLYHIQFLP
jgi:hypothetical protein